MEKIIIVAVSKNNVIGLNGKLPWNNPAELKFFKDTTINNAVVMGKKTFLSIGKPLNDRLNIVISRKLNSYSSDGFIIVDSIEESIRIAENHNAKKLYFIGGNKIYESALKIVDKIIISRIDNCYEGDTFFPLIDENIWFKEQTENRGSFIIEIYKRIDKYEN